MIGWSRFFALVLVVTVATMENAASSNIFKELEQAQSLNETGNYAEAKNRFAALLKTIPSTDREALAWAHFEHAFARDQLSSSVATDNKTLQAIADEYRQAAILDERHYLGAGNFNAGLVLRKLGKNREALEAFLLSTTSKHPERVRFLYQAGREYETLGMLKKATSTQREVLAQEPGNEDARKALLTLYVRQGLDESTLDLARSWSKNFRNLDYINYTLTTILNRKQPEMKPAQAESALLIVVNNHARLGLSPSAFESSVNLEYAKALAVHPQLAEPIKALRAAYADQAIGPFFEETPGSGWWYESDERRRVWSTVLKSQGNTYWTKGNYQLSKRYYEAAIGYRAPYELQPWVDLDAVVMLAAASAITKQLHQLQQLVAAVDRWTEAHPDQSPQQKRAFRDFYHYAAWSYTQAYDDARAIKLDKESLKFDPDFADAHVNLGFIYMGSLDLAKAINHFERAIELDDSNPTAKNNLGFTSLIHGDFEKAIYYLNLAYKLDNYLLVTVNLGDAYRYAGDAKRALQLHTEAMNGIRDRGNDESYMSTRWRYNYMPLHKGDSDTINYSIPVNTNDEKRAFVHYALSFDQALIGDLETAQRNFDTAVSFSNQPEFRCFFANKIAAIEAFVNIPPRSANWFDSRKKELKQGLPCVGS